MLRGSRAEHLDRVWEAIELLEGADIDSDMWPLLYQPDPRLRTRILRAEKLLAAKAERKLTKKQVQALGYILEEIALLAFQGLVGLEEVKGYQSAGAQHDLLVSGDCPRWLRLCAMLRINKDVRGILIESKATTGRVGDHEFERLGNIVSHHFGPNVALGVFFTVNGATGFPPSGKTEREIKVHGARLTQLVVFHSAKKPIVVLDWEDIRALPQVGSLPRILSRKVREIGEQSGLRAPVPERPAEVDLPPRLAKLCRFPAAKPVSGQGASV